jgi:antitoxin (DNA-binding transcriptional repressor) of toxin-antitoxin stability system
MKASIVDLRYKMKDVLKALDRKEKVTILYHGKVKGVIVPVNNKKYKKVKDHAFFGMLKDSSVSVSEEMQNLRGPRY